MIVRSRKNPRTAAALAMTAVAIGVMAIGSCKPPQHTGENETATNAIDGQGQAEKLPTLRTLIDRQGRTIEVTILAKRDGFIAAKRLSDSAAFSIAISSLSAEDQDFLASLPESNAEEVVAARKNIEPAVEPAVDPQRRAFWLTSFDSAVEDSRRTDLPILMIFTGSTWSEPCKRLESIILRDQRFIDFANRNLVLMKVDVPRRAAGGPQGDLVEQFGVKSVPTIMLIRDGKKPAARVVGYQDDNVDAMIRFVRNAGD